MVSSTMPMAAIAEAIQPRATAEQQAQADATSSGTGKAEDGTDTNATADTAEDSTATSTGTSAVNTESVDATTAATDAANPTPSLSAQATPTPEAISATSQTGYAHSVTASQNGVTFTVSWNDAPAGTATTFHVTQANGSMASTALAIVSLSKQFKKPAAKATLLAAFIRKIEGLAEPHSLSAIIKPSRNRDVNVRQANCVEVNKLIIVQPALFLPRDDLIKISVHVVISKQPLLKHASDRR